MKKIIDKPWGAEVLIEHNENYTMKILIVNMGEQLSLQYHNNKTETWFIASGEGLLILDDIKEEVSSGDSFTIYPKTVHSIIANTDIMIVEAATPELDDIVRLEDRYGRA